MALCLTESSRQFRINIVLSCLLFLSLFACKQEHKETNGHEFTNDLIHETSPYLIQHAHNPVNWTTWTEDAFDTAAKENKLVLVSIGYSSCHWCHVMEEETFEDLEVAALMNSNFINIKVDREERPDVDQIYQDFQRLTDGNTGWPLNVIVLPNGKPFYGGTYHTKDQWIQVLTKMNDLYKKDPGKAKEYTDMVTEGIDQINLIEPTSDFRALTKDALDASVAQWKLNWDADWGGNLGSEKFMVPVNIDFLMDYAELTGDLEVRAHVENTLDKILLGGIYDHVGGGFFRYSTDKKWKVPHFEKMLYDNAQAIGLYSKAFKVFKKQEYRDAVYETIAFLDREMKNEAGGYYSALDSQSEGKEGKFYVWTEEELKTILKGDFELFASYYNIAENTIWEEGNYVLHRLLDNDAFVKKHSISISELESSKRAWKEKLMEARGKRTRPRNDDKILTSWNALLINGLVASYEAFGQKDHLEKAQEILNFLKNSSYGGGELIHSYKEGSLRKKGFLEDYAFLMNASLGLYSATMDVKYLELTQELNGKVLGKFSDKASGMFKYNEGQELIAKIIKTNDGPLPSPNAVMAHNLFKLGHIMYDVKWMEKSKSMLSSMTPYLEENGFSYAKWNSLLLNTTYPFYEIAVVGDNANELVVDLNSRYIANSLIVGSTTKSELPLYKSRYSENETFIYVCRERTCKLPVTTVKAAMDQLSTFELSPL